MLSGSVTDSRVVQNEFARIGDSAIVLLGAAEIDDGTKPTYPNRNLIVKTVILSRVAVVSVANLKVSPFQERNHVHDYVRAVSASTGLEQIF